MLLGSPRSTSFCLIWIQTCQWHTGLPARCLIAAPHLPSQSQFSPSYVVSALLQAHFGIKLQRAKVLSVSEHGRTVDIFSPLGTPVHTASLLFIVIFSPTSHNTPSDYPLPPHPNNLLNILYHILLILVQFPRTTLHFIILSMSPTNYLVMATE